MEQLKLVVSLLTDSKLKGNLSIYITNVHGNNGTGEAVPIPLTGEVDPLARVTLGNVEE